MVFVKVLSRRFSQIHKIGSFGGDVFLLIPVNALRQCLSKKPTAMSVNATRWRTVQVGMAKFSLVISRVFFGNPKDSSVVDPIGMKIAHDGVGVMQLLVANRRRRRFVPVDAKAC